jgi:MacB-like periplasmic core domain
MLRQAVRDAFRVSRSTPWTSSTIILTLALGTGLNAAVLALVYGIFFRPLPYRDASRLVQIQQEIPLGQLDEWRARLRTVDRVAAFAGARHVLRGVEARHAVRAAFVSDQFFEVLGVSAAVGRTLDSATGPTGVILSRKAASAADADLGTILGRQLTIARSQPACARHLADERELSLGRDRALDSGDSSTCCGVEGNG